MFSFLLAFCHACFRSKLLCLHCYLYFMLSVCLSFFLAIFLAFCLSCFLTFQLCLYFFVFIFLSFCLAFFLSFYRIAFFPIHLSSLPLSLYSVTWIVLFVSSFSPSPLRVSSIWEKFSRGWKNYPVPLTKRVPLTFSKVRTLPPQRV